MAQTDNEFRPYIEKMSGGGLQCKFCGQTFAATTSITRFKWHWSGVEGHGVKICEKVTTDVQQKACQATQQASKKKRKTMPSSSNMHDDEVVNEVSNLAGEIERMQMEVREERAPSRTNVAGNHMSGGMTQPIGRSFSPQRLTTDAQYETRGDAQQATDAMNQLDIEGRDWTDLMNIAQSMEVLAENGDERSRDAIPTKKLVGGEFEKNKNAILSWLMDVEASSSLGICGIYGMGGVGKTTLLIHIYNLLIKPQKSFHRVSWVTVSRDFSISKLQNLIGIEFNLDLSREDNEGKRAAKLSKKLSEEKPWVLILDDLWDYFDFDKVGIPIHEKGC